MREIERGGDDMIDNSVRQEVKYSKLASFLKDTGERFYHGGRLFLIFPFLSGMTSMLFAVHWGHYTSFSLLTV